MRQAGIDVPYIDDNSIAEDNDDSQGDEDVAEGVVPSQPSTMVANNSEQPSPMGTNGKQWASTNGNQQW